MTRTIRSHEQHVPTWFGSSELHAYVDRFCRYMLQCGYSKETFHKYRNAVAHFARWMTDCDIGLSGLDDVVVDRFLRQHLPVCHCGPLRQRSLYTVRAALKVLLRFLRAEGVVGPANSTDPPAVAEELRSFALYQEHVCGLTQATRDVARHRIRAFLLDCFGSRAIRIDTLTHTDVMRFLTRYTANCTPRSRSVICRSVRGYLRFKALTVPYAETLRERLPRFALWRLASIPKSLSVAETEAILMSCKGNDPISRRDYAILRCLHDLGLRTIEVARLQLDDFDWKAGTVSIRGKGHRVDTMPLPAPTGQAIISYLRHGRPRDAGRALFFRHHPPLWSPATVFIVRATVRYAAKRAGLADRVGGPHIFRHTLAHRLVQRRASLKAIADLLRHRSLTSTRIYAKVDLPALSTVALPWPERRL